MTTCSNTETELKKWPEDFLLTACKSYTGSVAFMKTLSAIAVSTVLYNREIFPKTCFTIETCEGEEIPILKSKSNNEEADKFYSWIIGFQDALEKRYLYRIILSLYENGSKTIIENYEFSFMYKEENSREISHTFTFTVKDATMIFLKACGLPATKCKKLPEKYEIKMKLLYYDEDTPEDYEPPGFCACPDSDVSRLTQVYKKLFKNLVGSVATPYHKIRMITMRPRSPPLLEKSDETSDSEMEMETDDPDYGGRKCETPNSEPQSSRCIRKPVKRFSTEPVTEKIVKRKSSVID